MGGKSNYLFRHLAALCVFLIGTAPAIAADTNNSETRGGSASETPDSARLHYELGRGAISWHDWDKAVYEFTKVISIVPKSSLAYEYRGGAYFAKGDFDHAIGDFNEALKLDPTNPLIFQNRGDAFRAEHEPDKALHDFSECIRLDQTNSIAYKSRASIYSSKGETGKALNDWNKGLQISPDDSFALVGRGNDFCDTGNFDAALKDYREAARLDSTNALAQNQLGWLRATCPDANIRNGKEAVEAAMKACILTDFKNRYYLDTLAAAHAEMGNFTVAINYQNEAIAMSLNDTNVTRGMRLRLSLYEQKKPYREQPKK